MLTMTYSTFPPDMSVTASAQSTPSNRAPRVTSRSPQKTPPMISSLGAAGKPPLTIPPLFFIGTKSMSSSTAAISPLTIPKPELRFTANNASPAPPGSPHHPGHITGKSFASTKTAAPMSAKPAKALNSFAPINWPKTTWEWPPPPSPEKTFSSALPPASIVFGNNFSQGATPARKEMSSTSDLTTRNINRSEVS